MFLLGLSTNSFQSDREKAGAMASAAMGAAPRVMEPDTTPSLQAGAVQKSVLPIRSATALAAASSRRSPFSAEARRGSPIAP